MKPADIIRLTAEQEISRGRALELLTPHLLVWHRGDPPKSGMYVVQFYDGEHVITPWTKPGDAGVDTWGDERGSGWSCLGAAASEVQAWAKLPRFVPVDSESN